MRFGFALVLPLLALLACAPTLEGDVGDDSLLRGEDDELAQTSSALTGTVAVGTTLKATANLNLRSGPGTSNAVRLVMPAGSTMTVVTASPSNGFYNVKYNGTTGWASGQYLKIDTSGGGTGGGGGTSTAGLDDATRAGAVQRAKSGVGATYWWGHGRWFPFQQGGSNAGSCSGSCPNCSHSGGTGADCSGYVAKLWQVPSSNNKLTTDTHPYSTASFMSDTSMWRTISRGSLVSADALVYRSGGAGHILLYESGDGWGSFWAYEARGCSYGIRHNLRTVTSAWKAIRHY
ncbi:MAG: SH3 domain-containing protein [Myxococcaceae bacterium]|nr:SH3 domain-containing protein [Myxococcaceae bacterium]